jgi:PAS domain-containing protein
MEMVEEKRAAEEPDVADIAATDPTSSASMSAAASISSSVSDTATTTTTTTTTPAVPVRRVRKRRVPPTKVARACVHCKNAHITCEEKRPCTRCIKKGLQDSCVDAPRKARKYLLGIDNEALAFANTNTSTKTITTSSVTADLPLPHINELDTLVSTRRTMQPQHQHQPQPLNSTSINCTRQNSSSLPILMPEGIPSNEPSQSSNDINFLSSAADSEYAILGNIIDQTLFPGDSPMNNLNNGNEYGTRMAISNTLPTFNTSASYPNTYPLALSQSVGHGNGNGHQGHNHNHGLAPFHGKHVSPALSTTSDDLEYLNYQPLMTARSQSWTVSPSLNNSSNPASPSAMVAVSNSGALHSRNNTGSPFMKPLQPLDMLKTRNLPASSSNVGDDEPISTTVTTTGTRTMRKMKYSDLYPREPYCDASTNQYFIGTMSTIDGVKTHTFPEVVKQISKFKRDHPDKFKERNRRSAISFCVSILDDVNSSGDHESSPSNTATAAAAAAAAAAAVTLANTNSNDDSNHGPMYQSPGENCNWKCGLLYHEPSEIYEKVKQPFAYVRPYHDLNLYLKSRFPKEDLVHISKSIAEYRPSFIAGMIKLKEDDLIFAEQCFQRTLLEYDSYIGISGTPTLVWRRTSQIAYVGDEFCILTGWTREELLNKSTFAVEIMDDKSCVDYFKIFSKIAFGDMNGDILTECTLLTPKGESIRTSSVWTMKRDVFGIPMMIIATFLPILT